MKTIHRFIVLCLCGFCMAGGPLAARAGESNVTAFVGQNNHAPSTAGPRYPAITNKLGMTFVYLPPGRFRMGSPPDDIGHQANETRHPVLLTQGFYMLTTEVTQRQWAAVMGDNPSVFSDCGPDCPVDNVSWNDVVRFVAGLNMLMKKDDGHLSWITPAGVKNQKNALPLAVPRQYALPTEAQWEYACRAGSTGWFYFNGDIAELGDYAWFQGNAEGTPHPVATRKANLSGLYDMHGNVWEWCRDIAGPYPAGAAVDPVGPARGDFRVVRGGSWYYPALEARAANRFYLLPGTRNYNVGCRLALIP